LDSGRLGQGASTAGAGMLAPGGEFAEQSAWAALAVESLRLYPRYVEELRDLTGLPIDYRRCGAVESAADDDGWRQLLDRAASQQAVGIRSEKAGDRELFYP